MYKGILFALAATVAGATAAQTAAKPDPADPRVRTPSVEYRSAFETYRPFAEEKLAPWREANEEVKQQGGGHAGQSMHSKPQARPEAKPAPADHGGHK